MTKTQRIEATPAQFSADARVRAIETLDGMRRHLLAQHKVVPSCPQRQWAVIRMTQRLGALEAQHTALGSAPAAA